MPFFYFQLTVDFSLSLVHLCIKSAIFTSIVPLIGVAGTNCPLYLMLETLRNNTKTQIIMDWVHFNCIWYDVHCKWNKTNQGPFTPTNLMMSVQAGPSVLL